MRAQFAQTSCGNFRKLNQMDQPEQLMAGNFEILNHWLPHKAGKLNRSSQNGGFQ